ncbi:MAG: bifunctional hydroxymethylpyrimidine kinase/phosphomethylpyrimidine kinase [Anaerolineae bacterium]|nr:MAG: bifunctional hydroxymethylpyrimidine kinase/phosphomethylpyrimidine kinase [Anaerolineae bacterium]
MTSHLEERPGQPPKVLTIAGSDSGGAAGLQADLKTFNTLGVYGMSAVTVVTAQNSEEISVIQPIPSELVAAQIEAVLSDYGAEAIKSGFIGSPETIQAIGVVLNKFKPPRIIIDPVLVDHRGESMFDSSVSDAYIKYLFPLADLVTPNIPEAQILQGSPVISLSEVEKVARRIQLYGSTWVLIKGWRQDNYVIDILFGHRSIHQFRSHFIDTPNTHGSGDTLSAAICAFLAKDASMLDAVKMAHKYTNRAIRKAADWHLGRGHGPLYHSADNLA